MFEQYSFFENYDTVVFQNAQVNKEYKEIINTFANITQK